MENAESRDFTFEDKIWELDDESPADPLDVLFERQLVTLRDGKFNVAELNYMFILLPYEIMQPTRWNAEDTHYMHEILCCLPEMVKICRLPSTVKTAVMRLVKLYQTRAMEHLQPNEACSAQVRALSRQYYGGLGDAINHLIQPYH